MGGSKVDMMDGTDRNRTGCDGWITWMERSGTRLGGTEWEGWGG